MTGRGAAPISSPLRPTRNWEASLVWGQPPGGPRVGYNARHCELRDFGGLGPASHEASEIRKCELRDFGGLGPASHEASEIRKCELRDFGGLGPASHEASEIRQTTSKRGRRDA